MKPTLLLRTLLIGALVLLLTPAQVARGAAITVNTVLDDNTPNGNCTLREAIIAANTNLPVDLCTAGSDASADTITLAPGAVYSLTIPGSNEHFSATGDLDIRPNAARTELIINVAGGVATISQDATPDDERALEVLSATVEVTGIVFTGGVVGGGYGGGGISTNGLAKLTLIGCTITGNSTSGFGGGIFNQGTLILESSVISGNSSVVGGGGLVSGSGKVTIRSGSVIAGNSAENGGGIELDSGTLTLDASTLTGNVATIKGGGLYTLGGTVNIQNASVIGGGSPNSAPGGGGIYIFKGTVNVKASSVSGNSAGAEGGGILNKNGTLTVKSGSTISGNFSSSLGGGIHNESSKTVKVTDSTISGNVASSGGGIENFGKVKITGSTISGNVANIGGGGVSNDGTLTVTSSLFLNNGSATEFGDAVLNTNNSANAMKITESCIVGNGDTAVHNNESVWQIASNNWWGAPDGPSAPDGTIGATGFGDSVSGGVIVLGWKLTPILGCGYVPGATLLVQNQSFTDDSNGDGVPEGWTAANLNIPPDGWNCNADGCWVAMKGSTLSKSLTQAIAAGGSAGDKFTYAVRSKASSVPASGGNYRAQVKITYADATTETFQLNFASGTHNWKTLVTHFVAAQAYTGLEVKVIYSRNSGTASFDGVNLYKYP